MRRFAFVPLLVLAGAACAKKSESTQAGAPSSEAAKAAQHAAVSRAAGSHAAVHEPLPVLAAVHVADQLDTRLPVPLLPHMANHQKQNMREHLEDVAKVVAALAADDFAAVESAAGRMGSSEQMAQTCEHLGAGAPGFAAQAVGFHHAADGILRAARAQDKAAALRELSATLKTCTGCHATWKQQVVDEATWRALADASAAGH